MGGSHDDAVLVNRGLAYMLLWERERALDDITAATHINPYTAHAFFNRGHLNRSCGRLEEAQEDYSRGECVLFYVEIETLLL